MLDEFHGQLLGQDDHAASLVVVIGALNAYKLQPGIAFFAKDRHG
nr:hypothetical protein [uncultured Pseudogulbenkiania sp.]